MPQVAIVMPKMSMTMTEGELLTWHVKVGDTIKLGDVVCEVATDKIDMEVEATAAGTVVSLHGSPGDVLEVGTPLLMVESDSDDLLAGIFDAPVAPVAVSEPEAPSAPAEPVSPAAPTAPTAPAIVEKPLATPHARAVASDLNVTLGAVAGSGRDGVITAEDVQQFAEKGAASERTIEARIKTRRAIAKAIEASRDIPAFSMSFELPCNDRPRSDADLVVAWARTLRAFPELHANWNNGDLTTFEEVKVAVSVMATHGVLTPVVTVPADGSAFASELESVMAEAAKGRIALEHLSSSTTGFVKLPAGVVAANGILIKPQSMSIAVGDAQKCCDETTINLTITADHRIADPADVLLVAQRFVRELG